MTSEDAGQSKGVLWAQIRTVYVSSTKKKTCYGWLTVFSCLNYYTVYFILHAARENGWYSLFIKQSPNCLLTLGWACTLVWKMSVYLSLFQCDCTHCVLDQHAFAGNVWRVSHFSVMFRKLEQDGESLLGKMAALITWLGTKTFACNTLNSLEYTNAKSKKAA